jgi:hypothetical protein
MRGEQFSVTSVSRNCLVDLRLDIIVAPGDSYVGGCAAARVSELNPRSLMNKFKVAHLREQGVDLIIIPLDKDLSRKPPSEQSDIADSLQACAMSAGLAGTVVPVWDAGGGRMGFWAPENFHPYFRSISLQFVLINVNRELTCD